MSSSSLDTQHQRGRGKPSEALLLGAYQRGKMRCVANVGIGFKRQDLASLFRKFQVLRRPQPTVQGVPRVGRVTFLAPERVAQSPTRNGRQIKNYDTPCSWVFAMTKMRKKFNCSLQQNGNDGRGRFISLFSRRILISDRK
jgi:hypothetical protein